MSTEDTVARLRKSCFFCNMQLEELQKLSRICQEVELTARMVIFEEYDLAKDVYVIISGQVSLAICEPKQGCRQIAIVGEGELVGWSALLGKTRLSDTASTLTPVKAMKFNGAELSKFCTDHPVFGVEFMRQAACAMALRLSGTRLQLLQMCGNHFPLEGPQLESD